MIKQSIQSKGIWATLLSVARLPFLFVIYLYYRLKSHDFKICDTKFNYSYAFLYNRTWESERAVEIPIIKKIVELNRGKRILEVGNVLSHYMKVNHDVVDLYEKAHGVINQDIINYKSENKYDLIISISTIEHIDKVEEALDNMKKLTDGDILVTFPVGVSHTLDNLVNGFSEVFCLRRRRKGYNWVQTNWQDIKNLQYGVPYPNANGLVIGIIRKANVN